MFKYIYVFRTDCQKPLIVNPPAVSADHSGVIIQHYQMAHRTKLQVCKRKIIKTVKYRFLCWRILNQSLCQNDTIIKLSDFESQQITLGKSINPKFKLNAPKKTSRFCNVCGNVALRHYYVSKHTFARKVTSRHHQITSTPPNSRVSYKSDNAD